MMCPRFVPRSIRTAVLVVLISGCAKTDRTTSLLPFADTTVVVYGQYQAIRLPISKGVKMGNPIQIAMGPGNVMYACNQTGEVYTLHDSDGDGVEDSATLYCHVGDFGLRSPAGFTHHGDTIFIGTAQQIRGFLDVDHDFKADTSWTIFDQIPHSEHPYEWTSGLALGRDGRLYAALTTDSWNAAPSPDPLGYRGSIVRISTDGKDVERLATGIRSVPAMAFHESGDLFFIDNEGGGNPTEELNRLVLNAFYGHNKEKFNAGSTLPPDFDLSAEVAPSGIEFNKSENDFGGAGGNLFVAYYGPGERWTRGGVSRVELSFGEDGNYQYKEIPIADVPKLSDLAFGKDGNLYLAHHGEADYWYNAIYENQGGFYKLVFDPSIKAKPVAERKQPELIFSKDAIAAGKQLFAEQACLGCHQVDGVTELLGPNLKDVGQRLTRDEILEEIQSPSARIKPSMGGVRVVKKDGQTMIGRIISSDEQHISLMLVGNHIVEIPRNEIEKTENVKTSLMYEGLLHGLTEDQQNALLDYLFSLNG